MNVFLLTMTFSTFPCSGGYRPAWIVLLSVCTFSLEMQLITISGNGSLGGITLLNLAALVITYFFPKRRQVSVRFCGELFRAGVEQVRRLWAAIHGRSAALNRWTCAFLLLLSLLVLGRGALYLPHAIDPYHLMKVYHIERTGTLEYVSAADYKINVLNFLYELILTDLKLIPLVGGPLFQCVNIFFLLSFLLMVFSYFSRQDPEERYLYLWSCLCFMPLLFSQFMAFKNDYFVFLFVFPALVLLYRSPRFKEEWILVGILIGLAVSVKATALPLLIIAALFLPWGSWKTWFTARIISGGAALLGLACGGFFFNLVNNDHSYGSIVGPMEATGNFPSTPLESLISLLRLCLSLVDLGLLTPRIWPGRGGAGSHLGPLFVLLVGVYGVFLINGRRSLRLGAICAIYFLLFGAIYPDADLAHRMVIAPAVFFMAEVVRSVLQEIREGRCPKWVPLALYFISVLSFLHVLALGAFEFKKFEYLSSVGWVESKLVQRLLGAGESARPNARARQILKMRQINAEARRHEHVANIVQEDYLLLEGTRYAQIAVVERKVRGGYPRVWHSDRLNTFDFFIVGPNAFPANQAVLDRINSCLPVSSRLKAIHGADVPLRGISCATTGSRGTEGRD